MPVNKLAGSKEKAFRWFLNLFPRIPPDDADVAALPDDMRANVGKMTGEATPQYTDEPNFSPTLIRNRLPSAKIIVLVREPVSRFMSHCLFRRQDLYVNLGEEERRVKYKERVVQFLLEAKECKALGKTTFLEIAKCVDHPLGQVLGQNHPVEGIAKFLEVFPREQNYVMPSERLCRNPVEEMHALVGWLGRRPLNDSFWESVTATRHIPWLQPWNHQYGTYAVPANKSKSKEIGALPDDLAPFIRELFRQPNCELRRLLGEDWSEYGYAYCGGEGGQWQQQPRDRDRDEM